MVRRRDVDKVLAERRAHMARDDVIASSRSSLRRLQDARFTATASTAHEANDAASGRQPSQR